ncbi:MAG: YciE/YciF ferroxidase family protein [Gaiellaceae bacterium]
MSAVPGKPPAVKMPPSVETPRDQLVELLGRVLTIEETLVRLVLPELALEVQDEELGRAVRNHLEETRTHVGRVEQAFGALDVTPAGKPAYGLDGLRTEHKAEAPKVAISLRDGVHCAAAMGTEHYEINAYEAPIRLAEAMGLTDIGNLLRANLADEVTALETLATHSDRLAELAVEKPTAH